MAVRKLPVLTRGDAVPCCAPLAAEALGEADAAYLSRQFAALADPVRLRLVSLLATADGGEVCACDLVEPVGKSQPTVSHHLRALREAGLVLAEPCGRFTYYRLAPGAFDAVRDSIAGLAAASATDVPRRPC